MILASTMWFNVRVSRMVSFGTKLAGPAIKAFSVSKVTPNRGADGGRPERWGCWRRPSEFSQDWATVLPSLLGLFRSCESTWLGRRIVEVPGAPKLP